jgi:hypothetical protein
METQNPESDEFIYWADLMETVVNICSDDPEGVIEFRLRPSGASFTRIGDTSPCAIGNGNSIKEHVQLAIKDYQSQKEET